MTQPAKAQEPSMEEILASIRRIIADDDASKAVQPAPKPAAPPPPESHIEVAPPPVAASSLAEQAADILDLTESMAAPGFVQPSPPPAPSPAPVAPAPQFRKIEGHSDVSFDEGAQKPVSKGFDEQLLSQSTSAAVDSAFNALAQTVLVQNARTLEDLVREMLRPMLKSWLDDNLPGLVERMVRAEIERVARGR
jgi:uncharacterized protein